MGAFYDAVVADTADPERLGRVRLQIPQISGGTVTGWAQPMQTGWSVIGDRVYAAFKGGDPSLPIFMPRSAASPWLPLTIATGFQAVPLGTGQPPAVRVRADGYLEFSGTVRATSAPQVQGTRITFATLPVSVPAPQTGQQQIMASSFGDSLQSFSAAQYYLDLGTTTSISYTDTLTGSANTVGPAVTFLAPAGGSVIVSLGAMAVCSVAPPAIATMSARVTQGGGAGTILLESDDTAVLQSGTALASVATAFPVTGLISGMNYSLSAYYRNTTAGNTASFRRRWVRVDPVSPGVQPSVLVSVYPDGTLGALFPLGIGTTDINLTGLVARYQ